MSRYWVVWQVRGLADVTVDTSHQERITVRTGQQLEDWCLGANRSPALRRNRRALIKNN